MSDLPDNLIPVKFDWSTGNVHMDRAIQQAAELAVISVKNQLAAAMAEHLKRQTEVLTKFPPPAPGSVLRRANGVDKICVCGRCVTFPLMAHSEGGEG